MTDIEDTLSEPSVKVERRRLDLLNAAEWHPCKRSAKKQLKQTNEKQINYKGDRIRILFFKNGTSNFHSRIV